MKTKKGITLIALIITIIVMLILVGVTANVAINGELFKKSREGTYSYKVETIKENLSGYEVDYYMKTGNEINDKVKDAIAKISIETGIEADRFIVYHDKIAIKKNREEKTNFPEIYIFYNWNKANIEEIKKLEEINIEQRINENNICLLYNRCFICDINGDGYFDKQDYDEFEEMQLLAKKIEDIVEQEKVDYYKTIYQGKSPRRTIIQIGDLDNNGRYSVSDSSILLSFIKDEASSCFYEWYIDNSTQRDVEYYNR